MALKRSSKQLVDEASARIRTISVEEAKASFGDADVVFVDIRDVRELERDGMIPGALHAPRGMLEFWVDPESPYYKEIFGSGKRFILYCAASWRSALAAATLQDMGLDAVCHMDGGFTAWKESGGPVAPRPSSKPKA
ncbi:MAG: rhodanese-like domain-containing protein [Betaproteobacteria bacterium]|nr:MAG: rhodanese-like domain-containing protein [Betaproteobacteria bacterium]